MLDPVEHLFHPRQRVLLDPIDRLQAKLGETAIGDVADIRLHFLAFETFDGPHLERQVDEGILVVEHGFAGDIKLALEILVPDFRVLVDEGAEQLDDRGRVQAFVAHRPGDDLAHALHLVVTREVHQDREGGKQLQPFGERAEHRQGHGDVTVGRDPELLHVVVLVLHLLIFQEGRVLGLGHPDRVEQMGIGRNVHGLDIRESGQHHLHFGGFKHLRIMLHVAVVHFHIGLGEEAENMGQQVALAIAEDAVPVLDVIGQGHLFGQPVNTLLHQPGVIGPGVAEWLVLDALF